MSYRETDIATETGHTHEGSPVDDVLGDAHLVLIVLVPAAEWPPTDPTEGVLYLMTE